MMEILTNQETAKDKPEILIGKYVDEMTRSLGRHKPKLDRLSALLRMADGVDIDHTRLPVAHILKDPERSIKDDCENFKRQVLDRVEIDRGTISLRFRLPPEGMASEANGIKSRSTLAFLGVQKRTEFSRAELANKERKKGNGRKKKQDPEALVEKKLREILRAIRVAKDGNWPPVDIGDIAEEALGLFFGLAKRPGEGWKRLAISITAALAVCSEVQVRYMGITDTGLQGVIKLGDVTFEVGDPKSFSLLDEQPPYVARAPNRCPPPSSE